MSDIKRETLFSFLDPTSFNKLNIQDWTQKFQVFSPNMGPSLIIFILPTTLVSGKMSLIMSNNDDLHAFLPFLTTENSQCWHIYYYQTMRLNMWSYRGIHQILESYRWARINFRDKNAIFTNFRDKNAVFTSFCDKNYVFELHDTNTVFGFNFVCLG